MSAADKARHYRLGHGRKRGIERKETTNDKTPRLTCDIYSASFVTQWRLKVELSPRQKGDPPDSSISGIK